jgi:hypothetical protein
VAGGIVRASVIVRLSFLDSPETGLGEINGDFLEADFPVLIRSVPIWIASA